MARPLDKTATVWAQAQICTSIAPHTTLTLQAWECRRPPRRVDLIQGLSGWNGVQAAWPGERHFP